MKKNKSENNRNLKQRYEQNSMFKMSNMNSKLCKRLYTFHIKDNVFQVISGRSRWFEKGSNQSFVDVIGKFILTTNRKLLISYIVTITVPGSNTYCWKQPVFFVRC